MLREPWRTRLLFISVAGNLFAIGLIGAHVALRPRGLPPGAPHADALVERMARDLAPPDAERFRSAMRPHLPQMEASRVRMEAARAAMARAIAQTPYDEGNVRQAIKAWQQSWLVMSDDVGVSMMAAVSDLSPDGRRRLAEAGMRRHP